MGLLSLCCCWLWRLWVLWSTISGWSPGRVCVSILSLSLLSVLASIIHRPPPLSHSDLLLWGCLSHPPITNAICYRLQLGSRKMPHLPQLLKASGRAIRVYKKRGMVVFLVAAWFLEGRNGELTPLKILIQLLLVIVPNPVSLFNFPRSNPRSWWSYITWGNCRSLRMSCNSCVN